MAEMKNYSQLARAMRKTTPYFAFLLFGLMLLGHPVSAQEESGTSSEEFLLEDVVVTGSILRTQGIDLPTPVTVITPEELDLIAPFTLIEGLAELPQFYMSSTTQSLDNFWNATGAGSLNLRGLQSKRSLNLLNGRRVVQSTLFGGPDINLFPEMLIKSVETVTGGASAAYGTGAVAGAINFILNTDYEGIKVKVQTGEAAKGYNDNYEFEVAGGFALSDKTHVLFAVEKSDQDPIWGKRHEYRWWNAWGLVENPDENAGTTPDNPYYLPAERMRSMNISYGGILGFPESAGGRYIWQNGQFVPYIMGEYCNGHGCSTINGGSGDDVQFYSNQISPDTGRQNVFGYIEHDFNDNLTVYGQALYAELYFQHKSNVGLFTDPPGAFFDRAFTIYSGNPFLPPEMQQIMTDNGLDSVMLGRMGAPEDLNANGYLRQETDTLSLTAGLEYEVDSGFFEGWQVRSYFQYGETDVRAIQHDGVRLDRVYIAADAVIDPATGLPACNVTVTSREAGNPIYQDCVPLNLFGRGNASPEAIDWVLGFEPGAQMHAEGVIGPTERISHDYVSDGNKTRVINIDQKVFDVRVDGELYEGWGAGPIIMGLGYGYREESFVQYVEVGPGGNVNADPGYYPVMANDPALGIRGVPGGNKASGNLVEIQFSNVPFARGDQNVHEAFTELLVPLIADLPFIEQLNFTGAARWAEYSGAGVVWSWKTGLDYTITDEIRLRGTVSQDVRAATMAEKFDRTGGAATVTDYLEDPNGGSGSRYPVIIYSDGSPDIQPEDASTQTFGVVYMPKWLEGLSLSADWYSVEIKDNINQLSAAEVVERCYVDGDQDLCGSITRGGEPSEINPGINRISLVGRPYINQASVKATGVDLETSYAQSVDWFGGGESINLRLIASYLRERSNTNSEGVTTEFQGALNYPEWTGILSGTYRRGPFNLSMQARYVDEQLINRNWNHNGNSTQWDVFDNLIESRITVNTRVGYTFEIFDGDLDLFLHVNNLFDKDPEQMLTGASVFSSTFWNDPGFAVASDQDKRGRRYTLGLNFEYKF